MLRTIVLHGALGAEFGPSFRLDVVSAAEAVRALCLQIRGFRNALRRGHYRVTRLRRGRPFDFGEEMLRFPLGSAEELHITPVIAGAGAPSRATSTGKVVAGAILVAAAVAAPLTFGASTVIAGTGLTVGSLSFSVAAIGLGLALSGIAGLLTKQPQSNESFMFGGQLNVTTQGGPVPLVYGGPVMAGSVTISAGLFSTSIAVGTQPFNNTTAAFSDTYQQTD
jgi:predicted phage tail protein